MSSVLEFYDLIENEQGMLTAKIREGVTVLEETLFSQDLFEYNERVTRVHIPDSLESCYVYFPKYFPQFKQLRMNESHPHRENFRFDKQRYFCSADQPKAVPTHFSDNGDGTFTVTVPEGMVALEYIQHWHDVLSKATVLRLPASLKEIGVDLGWHFPQLQEICVHPDNASVVVEDAILFSADKKKIFKYLRGKAGDTYRMEDTVEEIAAGCFGELDHLKNLYIGKGVRKIGSCALVRDMVFALKKIYIPPTVVEIEGEIFDAGGDSAGTYYPIDIVGGARGSAIEVYCNRRGIDFVAVTEDEVEDFYAATVEELRERAAQQAEQETTFVIDESDCGYRMRFAEGSLEVFVPDGVTADEVVVSETKSKIGKHRRDKVKTLIIGAGITGIDSLAFDDYHNLEQIAIGPDVRCIQPGAFMGENARDSVGCRQVATVTVEENNRWYTAVDNVLYTADRQTLVWYAPAKPELYYEVDPHTRHIADWAFERAKYLQCLKVGEGCVSVGKSAFLNTADNLRHVYFAASVTDWPEVYPFINEFGFDRPWRSNTLVVGGPEGSTAQAYCTAQREWFCALEESEIADFLATPLPDTDDDAYLMHFTGGVPVDDPEISAPDVVWDGDVDDLPF